jgi:hypothetical protein
VAAYEVLLLNTAIPQIQAAQTGDTYVVPRDIAFSAALTLSAGTANGVPYLNASKVLTTGSALTYSGNSLTNTIPSNASLQLGLSVTNATNADFNVRIANNLTDLQVSSATPLSFTLGASEQMRLTTSGLEIKQSQLIGYSSYAGIGTNGLAVAGNVGVGTASPVAGGGKIQAVNSAGSLFFSGYDTTANKVGYAVTTSAGTPGQVNHYATYFGTGIDSYHAWYVTASSGAQTQALTLNTSGNLGLGQVPAVRKFEINAISAAVSQLNGIRLQMDGVATSASEFLVGTDSGGVPFSSLRTGNDGNSYMTFFTGSGPTERARITSTGEFQWKPDGTTQAMTLDASGNLGVGVTSVGAKIQAETNASSGDVAVIAASKTGLGYTTTLGYYASAGTATAGVVRSANSLPLALEAGGTERARITSGGDLWVGTDSVGSIANGGFAFNALTNSYQAIGHKLGTASGDYYIGFYYDGGVIGNITQNGTTAVAYNTSSDYRLKDNPQPLTNSGAFIDALKPKIWNWKADGSKGVGFIAHEVQEVSPGTVVGAKDAVDADGKPVMQAMEYGSAEFIANIVAELQSLRARVAQLEQGA